MLLDGYVISVIQFMFMLLLDKRCLFWIFVFKHCILALESSVYWLMLDYQKFFLSLFKLVNIFCAGLQSTLLHLLRFHWLLFPCLCDYCSEYSLSSLQNSPLVSILILKSLVSMDMSCLTVFYHLLVTSPVHSG